MIRLVVEAIARPISTGAVMQNGTFGRQRKSQFFLQFSKKIGVKVGSVFRKPSAN